MDETRLKDLTKSLQAGNKSSFDEIFDLSKKVVFYNIYSIVQNYEASEDLTQDVYVKFLENLNTIDVSKSISGYLMILSKNVALNHVKKFSKEDDYEEYEIKNSQTDEYGNDEEILINKIKKILNDKEFNIFLLHYYGDLTFDEIAKAKKMPLGTIIWLYNSGIKKLRKELSDYDS